MSEKSTQSPRKTPIGYEDKPDRATKGAFQITGITIGLAAIICLALIVFVVMRSGGV